MIKKPSEQYVRDLGNIKAKTNDTATVSQSKADEVAGKNGRKEELLFLGKTNKQATAIHEMV